MLTFQSIDTYRAYAKQELDETHDPNKLCEKVDINGQIYDVQFPPEGFTVSFVGSSTHSGVTPLTETPQETAEKIQTMLRSLVVTGMGAALQEETGWLGGAKGEDGKETPPPQSPKPDELGAVGGVEIPPFYARKAIDLSEADADLLEALQGMSLAAQACIVDDWPAMAGMDYDGMLDTTSSAQEMPGDKPAKVKGVEVTSQMLKQMQVRFDSTGEFKAHAEKICGFPRTVSPAQTLYMLSGRINIGDFDFKVDWEDDKPKVTSTYTPAGQKKKAEEIRQEITKILEAAISDKPSTSSEGASAKP